MNITCYRRSDIPVLDTVVFKGREYFEVPQSFKPDMMGLVLMEDGSTSVIVNNQFDRYESMPKPTQGRNIIRIIQVAKKLPDNQN